MMSPSDRIAWYYMWTPNYEFFHRLIQESFDRFPKLRHDFCDRPIFYEQALFNKKLSTEPGVHSFQGSNLKVDMMIQCIEQNMGQYFIFSDADIYVASARVKDMCDPFMKDGYDTVFMKEDGDASSTYVNIGFILTKATEVTLALWKDIQRRINLAGGHDQTIMNEILTTWSGKWGTFDTADVASNKTHKDTFIIFQFLSATNGYVIDMAEKVHNVSKLYDISHLLHLVSGDIIAHMNMFIENKI